MLQKIKKALVEANEIISFSDVLCTLAVVFVVVFCFGGLLVFGIHHTMLNVEGMMSFCFEHTWITIGIIEVLTLIVIGSGFYVVTRAFDALANFVNDKRSKKDGGTER